MKKMNAPTAKNIRLGDGAYITVVMDGESLTIKKSESADNFDRALQALKDQNWDSLYEAMRPVRAFAQKIKGVTVERDGVYFEGEPVHNAVATRIMDFAMAGLDFKPLCRFFEKLMLNPSKRAIDELYTFLDHQNLPITDNGNFLAYKGLLPNYYSITSGKAKLVKGKVNSAGQIFNGVGEEIEMLRRDVDDDKDRGCSYGLHAGTQSYASGFARGKMVVVEINPKDVVSIPTDCSYQKLRTCAYKVVGEYDGPLVEPLYESRYEDEDLDYSDDYYDNFGDEEEVFYTENSSWVEKVTFYNGDLTIYKYEGDPIVYFDVDYELFDRFKKWVEAGKSAGRFFNQEIRDVY